MGRAGSVPAAGAAGALGFQAGGGPSTRVGTALPRAPGTPVSAGNSSTGAGEGGSPSVDRRKLGIT